MPSKHNILLNKSLEDANCMLNKAIELYSEENYKKAAELISEAHKIFLVNKNTDKVSVCLSLTGLLKYLDKKESYYKSLLLIEDAKFLAENTNQYSALAVNKLSFAHIYYCESQYKQALYQLKYCENELDNFPLLKIKMFELSALANIRLQKSAIAYEYFSKAIKYAEETGNKNQSEKINKISSEALKYNLDLDKAYSDKDFDNFDKDQNTTLLIALSKIARAVNADVGLDNLLVTIAEQTKLILNADRCSVFLYDKEANELWSKVALGMNSEKIHFSVDKGFAGYVFKTGETVKIDDTYNDSRFNKEIDEYTGYKTFNMLCMPIRNIKYEIIGVFQVLNKKSGKYTQTDEDILFAIGTNAGIAIENSLLLNIQQKMINEQRETFSGFIDTLAASIEARDKLTLGHSRRVKLYSELISKQLNLTKEFTEIISRAAMLHDIGKIGIRDDVLLKKGTLTKEEFEHIKEHAKITYDILKKTETNESFSEIAEIAASHHEKYDGSGYFRGLKGDEIPLGGRILAVSDVFDAITSVRHYRDRMPIKDAINIIIEGKNKHFDPKIVDAFLCVPCDLITDILISEYNIKIDDETKKLLSSITLKQFAYIWNKKELSEKEKAIIKNFNTYYIREDK